MGHFYDETTATGTEERNPSSGNRRPFLIVMSGARFGEAVPVTTENVLIGRSPDADLQLEEEGVSRQHAKVVALPHNQYLIKDLGSKNGTLVNDERIDAHPLEHGDTIQVGVATVLRFSLEDSLETRLREHLFSEAMKDPLTGLKNRKAFDDELLRALAFSRRHHEAISIVLFDADHFKKINDDHGHAVGDEVLKELSVRVTQTIRTEDHLSRIGGEEFALVLRGIDARGAVLAAERIRLIVSENPVTVDDRELFVTISLGCATFDPTRHRTQEQLFDEADAELYRAKQRGRNQVSPSLPSSSSEA